MSRRSNRRPVDQDQGAILPLVLVVAVVLSLVVVAIASYTTSGLTYANVVEERADRLAAADGGMQYAIEKLRLNKTLCTSDLAIGGTSAVTPPDINAAPTTVTCQRVGAAVNGAQGWAIVLTGGTSGAGQLRVQGGVDKKFTGPVYVFNPNSINISGGDLTIENGDLWYGRPGCPSAFPSISGLKFEPPFLRGPVCTTASWSSIVSAPSESVPTTAAPAPVPSGSCLVFSPGKYTSQPALGPYNYFKAGNYYFEDTIFEVKQSQVIAGFSDGRYGDAQAFTASPDCSYAQSVDAMSGVLPGATFFLGGSSRIYVDTQGELEILRRAQGNAVVSVHALDNTVAGQYKRSTLEVGDPPIVDVKPGTQQDLAMHGLVWAPRAFGRFDNVANKARGQALGGVVIGSLEAQSSNGDGLLIRVETNPVDTNVLLVATATKGGGTTTIRAVVQVQPDTDQLVINSWRVAG